MNRDIKIATSYPDHPKIRKLKKMLSAEGVMSHLFLLCFVGRTCPSGKLEDMDKEDIASVAQWRGQPEEFVDTLMELKLLDKVGDIYSIHNWQKHNYYAMTAEARSAVARQNANKRWSRRHKKALKEIQTNQEDNAIGNADSNATATATPTSTPPSPSNDGVEMEGEEVGGSDIALEEQSSPPPGIGAKDVIDAATKLGEKYDYSEALHDADFFMSKEPDVFKLWRAFDYTLCFYEPEKEIRSVRRFLYDQVNERTGHMFGFQQ